MNKWVLFKSAHLDVAVVVSSMAAVPRVHKDSIETIHHWIARALGHERANVQELWVANVLTENHQSAG